MNGKGNYYNISCNLWINLLGPKTGLGQIWDHWQCCLQRGGRVLFENTLSSFEGTFWKKWIFRASTLPPTPPPAKSTLVLYDFCHKNRLNTPHPSSFLPKVPIYLAFSRHTMSNRVYFCLKCHYNLGIFNFRFQVFNCLVWLKVLRSLWIFTMIDPLFLSKSRQKSEKIPNFVFKKYPGTFWILQFWGSGTPPHPTPG